MIELQLLLVERGIGETTPLRSRAFKYFPVYPLPRVLAHEEELEIGPFVHLSESRDVYRREIHNCHDGRQSRLCAELIHPATHVFLEEVIL